MRPERPYRVIVEFPTLGIEFTQICRVRAKGIVRACVEGARRAFAVKKGVVGRRPTKIVMMAERLPDEFEEG